MSEVLSLFFSSPELDEGPVDAWAGLCGDFVGLCYEHARAEPKFAGLTFLSKAVYLSMHDEDIPPAWDIKALPGLTVDDILALEVEKHLDHCWMYFEGKHYDAAHLEGVDHPFDFRIFRQVFVEVLEEKAPERLAKLVEEYPWWKESQRLLNEFLLWKESDKAEPKNLSTTLSTDPEP